MNRRLALFAFLLVFFSSAWAQHIVDTAAVKAAVERGVLLWDARDESAYERGHIPGAVNIGAVADELRDANKEDYLPLPQLEKILGAAGLDPRREIIVYAQRAAPFAYFAHFTLRYFGAIKASIYHDGIDGWRAAGGPIATTPTPPKPVALKLAPRPELIAETRDVIAALNRPGVQIVDVRTPREYRGEDVRAIRGGHVPGAINIPYEQNWRDPDTAAKMRRGEAKDSSGMALKSADDLRQLYALLDPGKETIVYCQSGARAAQTATVLTDLGFKNVRVYDSAWLGYAAALSAPADNEVFVNIGALNNQLRALEGRIDALEAAAARR
jgi:thiosulfate/3-mercaptopyruvate sulfurtransferase